MTTETKTPINPMIYVLPHGSGGGESYNVPAGHAYVFPHDDANGEFDGDTIPLAEVEDYITYLKESQPGFAEALVSTDE